MITSCQGLIDAVVGNVDNPAPTTQPAEVVSDLLKQGVWTEFDIPLEASDDDSDEELDDVPSLGMLIDGNKAYFFTYSAEGADNLVEGTVSYNKAAGTGSITFPTITGSPLSGQTVNFTATSDETLKFEYTYGDKKLTAGCAWLCKDLDGWDTEGEESDWEELLTYYSNFSEDEGPDGSIDWSGDEVVEIDGKKVTVTDLDKPLVLEQESAAARGNTRMVGAIIQGVSTGLEIASSLFEPDPEEEKMKKLDAIIEKVDNVLTNQKEIMEKLDTVNARLIAIAQKLSQQELVTLFNNRNTLYYNKLKVQNNKYFEDAYKAYKANKNDPELVDYAKAWVGKNEEFANLTWEYMEYLTTVKNTDYGAGMAAIYDGLTFDKYPWEHLGTADRIAYRAYDMGMIVKGLFMICLYSQYGGLNNVEKKGLYNNYKTYKAQLKEFCQFKVSDPKKFRVCQIKGAHFIMHNQLQRYYYGGDGTEAPVPNVYGYNALYLPKWHKTGSIKINNPDELKKKLIRLSEMSAVFKYYSPGQYSRMSWTKMLVDGDNAAGAVYAEKPGNQDTPILLVYNHIDTSKNGTIVIHHDRGDVLAMYGMIHTGVSDDWWGMGSVSNNRWTMFESERVFYAAIVEKHY